MTLDNLSDSSLKWTWPAMEEISVEYPEDRVQYRTVMTDQEAASVWAQLWPTHFHQEVIPFGKSIQANTYTVLKYELHYALSQTCLRLRLQ
jgi:hypothetical protein